MKASIRKRQPVLLMASLPALALFVALSLSIDSSWLHSIDYDVLLTANISSPAGHRLFQLITVFGSDYVLGVTLLLTAIILYRHGMFTEMLTAIAVGLSAKLLEQILKALFQRSRPFAIAHEVIAGYSFPSGHSLNSIAIYGVVLLLLAVNTRSVFFKLLILLPGWVFLFMIGASRVVIGLHWPSDVIGGWLLGVFLVSLGFFLGPTFSRQPVRKQNIVMRQIES